MSSRLTALLSRFRRDSKANVAITFTLAALPIIAAIGCATDYTNATRIKAKMQAAADAAAVASVSKNSAAYLAATQMTSNGPVAAGTTEANAIFNGNIYNFTSLYTNPSVTSTVTKTGVNLTSVVQFGAQVPTTFLPVLGLLVGTNKWQTLTIGGSSSATSSLPKYIDFYLMLDVSGSMGLPSTTAEAARFQLINPDNYVDYPTGCTLACHFPQQNAACINPTIPPVKLKGQAGYPVNNYCLGYTISRVSPSGFLGLLQVDSKKQYPYTYPNTAPPASQQHLILPSTIVSGLPNSIYTALGPPVQNCPSAGTDNCIQLRLDAVGYSVAQLLKFATDPAYELIQNEFRVGLFPYIKLLDKNYSPLTNQLTGGAITTAANNLAQELDTNQNSALGSGGTDQDKALSTVNGMITTVGDGSASNSPLPYVFMITDGAVTPQQKTVPNGGWSGSNHDTVIPNPDTNCTNMKNRGIKIAILNIPFQPISPPNPSFANDEDDYANSNIPNIDGSLKACASPGFYYTANTPQDITTLLQILFKQALTDAHVTN